MREMSLTSTLDTTVRIRTTPSGQYSLFVDPIRVKHALLGVPLAEELNLRPKLRDLLRESLYRSHFDGLS